MLEYKSFGGNIIMKFDIKKAFDSLDWNFLLKVLKAFGCNSKFCHWIDVILKSARIFVCINGKPAGFFKCIRGVRQGIVHLVNTGSIKQMTGPRGFVVPSHALYADDILVFL